MANTQCLPVLVGIEFPIDQAYNKTMLIRKAYKYRLKTKPSHELKLRRAAGCSRYVWNKALAVQKDRLDKKQPCLSYNELAGLLIEWKKDKDISFLREVHSQPQQQTLKALHRAIHDALDRPYPKRFPSFKRKGVHDSFRYPQGFQINGDVIYRPKIGWIQFYKSREIEGIPKNVTVSRQGAHGDIAIQVEIECEDPVHPSKEETAIDPGITQLATLSDGTFYKPLNSFKTLESALARSQRDLSRKDKFSKNWHKQKDKVNKIHTCIAGARSDYLHKISTTISKNHVLIVLEDLKVANMSARGIKEQPGRQVTQKSGLNKAILEQGWDEFRRMLEYKQLWRGGLVVAVPPHYTSQTCPACGHVHSDNRKTQCHYMANADHVGARNILAAGYAVLACGEVDAVKPLDEAGIRKDAA